jgi:hypothetical protein
MRVDTPPDHVVDAIEEEVKPALRKYSVGLSDHQVVGQMIWGTAAYVLRDISKEEAERYASLMHGAIGSHDHFVK